MNWTSKQIFLHYLNSYSFKEELSGWNKHGKWWQSSTYFFPAEPFRDINRIVCFVKLQEGLTNDVSPRLCALFIGRTDAETEAPTLWPPDMKSQLLGKDAEPGTDWGQEEKGATVDKMVGWHRRLNGHEFEQTPGDSEDLGGLACCSPWGRKESDMT